MAKTVRSPRTPATPAPTFTDWLRRRTWVILDPIAGFLARTGLTPNTLTLIGLALNVAVAAILARGGIRLGGVLLLGAAGFDALDGAVARKSGRQSRFGAFFDSTLDRYSEAAIFGGLLYYFANLGEQTYSLVVYAAIIGSLMVSYTRARAEGLGIECKVGLATRVERTLIIAAGLILGLPRPALWVVAVLAHVTAVQRMLHVSRAAREEIKDS